MELTDKDFSSDFIRVKTFFKAEIENNPPSNISIDTNRLRKMIQTCNDYKSVSTLSMTVARTLLSKHPSPSQDLIDKYEREKAINESMIEFLDKVALKCVEIIDHRKSIFDRAKDATLSVIDLLKHITSNPKRGLFDYVLKVKAIVMRDNKENDMMETRIYEERFPELNFCANKYSDEILKQDIKTLDQLIIINKATSDKCKIYRDRPTTDLIESLKEDNLIAILKSNVDNFKVLIQFINKIIIFKRNGTNHKTK